MTTLVPSTTAMPWSGGNVVRPLDRGAAVERLPGTTEHDPFERLAMAFLVGYTASSARAYLADLKAWGAACVQLGTHPFLSLIHISEPTRRTPISYAVF